PDDDKLKCIPYYFGEEPKSFIQTLPPDKKATFKAFKKAVVEKYTLPGSNARFLKEFESIVQQYGETVAQFETRVIIEFERALPNNKCDDTRKCLLLNKFYNGLLPVIKAKVDIFGVPDNIDDVRKRAQNVELQSIDEQHGTH